MRRRGVTGLCWTGAGVLTALSLAWLFEGSAWALDLIANLNAQWLALGVVWILVCGVGRRVGPLLLTLVACGLLLTPMLLNRAAIVPQAAAIPRAAAPSDDPLNPVRILHYNARSVGSLDDHLELMRRTDADVISLLGPSVQEQFRVIYGDGLDDQYKGKLTRKWKPGPDGDSTYITAAYLVSRWKITALDVSYLGEMSEHLIVGRVERPGAPFVVVAMHPRSPRNIQRWVEGNLTVNAAAEAVRRISATGVPVVVIADLNSTPSGLRCRELCSGAHLQRAKPLLLAEGTYPEGWPLGTNVQTARSMPAFWPTTLAIDDVWIGRGMQVKGWSRMPPLRSEHRPIVVDLVIPQAEIADK